MRRADPPLPPLAVAAFVLGVALVGMSMLVGDAGPWWHASGPAALALGLTALAGGLLAAGPLRRSIDARVTRSRAHALGLAEIDRFLADLRAGRREPEAALTVLREVLACPALDLLVVLPDDHGRATVDGRPATPAATGLVVHEVEHAGEVLAELTSPPGAVPHPELVGPFARAATLAIEITRLRVELRRSLAATQESRARIVAAGDAERRRVERNLHDGAQQRLTTVGLEMRHAQHLLGARDEPARDVLDHAVTELGHAIEDLRELARGVLPSSLDEGLDVALGELATRASIRVTLDVPGERFPAALETAAYFVAAEGLTNAIKHGHPTRCHLAAARSGAHLLIRVEDDGVGGADPAGGGLRGLADRVAAHGGRLSVVSPAGAGTTLIAELPCGS